MSDIYLSDQKIQNIVEVIDGGAGLEFFKEIDAVVAEFPADARGIFLRHALHAKMGHHKHALNDLWSCLQIDPREELFSKAISELLIKSEQAAVLGNHNLNLTSGERQTAGSIEMIRTDHTARYRLAAALLLDKHESCTGLNGLDLFCGNGYGSRLLHNQTGARIFGVDGSSQAIELAKSAYGNHRVVFSDHYYPFDVLPGVFDFVVCYESVEHVLDDMGFMSQIFSASQGPVFLSVPAEETLPFDVHKGFFKFHHRHYTLEQIIKKCEQFTSHSLESVYGQTVYEFDKGKIKGLVSLDRMYIRPHFADSQFHLLHFTPR